MRDQQQQCLPVAWIIKTETDLAILGGGINGVAVARDAAQRGLTVTLFEKGDFASGASSKSSKLVHGGLRYLSALSFGLVKESLYESSLLLKNAPHLVKPLPFLYPVYKNGQYPLWLVKLAISFYDWLKPNGETRHQNLTARKIGEMTPRMSAEGLKGGCLYYDAQMQDNRLVIENMLSAEQEGATLLNYTEVTQVVKEPQGFQIHSTAGIFRAKCMVNATGAWSNLTRGALELPPSVEVHPTKGVHLVIPQIIKEQALALTAPQDGRLFFLIPWMGYSLLGTTDTPFSGDPGDVKVELEDQEYLLTALRHYFPHLRGDQVIASFAALRPLAYSSESREHHLHLEEGILTILGGKYTTYRHIAEEAVDKVVRFLKLPARPCRTAETPLYGAQKLDFQKNSPHAERLIAQYGTAAEQILKIIEKDPQEAEQICPHHPHIYAELTYAIQKEKARSPEDWFFRRTSIGYGICGGKACYDRVAKRF